MRAAVFDSRSSASGDWVSIEDLPRPQPPRGDVLLKVIACGVCRTDLHIVEGDLPPIRPRIIPGHQIVGEVVEGATPDLPIGTRVGVSWMGGVDGDCWFCRHNMENLCDHPVFTGYSVNGGYAEYAPISRSRCLRVSTPPSSPRCYVRGSSASAAFALRESSAENA